jgi:MoaA/NifB/PqqE/SkfB family radical SAM enzyme
MYFHLRLKFAGYKLFNKKSPFYGSAYIINVCNLHCEHCYWWLNRKEEKDLILEQWKRIIDEKFKKNHVFMVTLVGGEPLMRKDVVELFVKEFPKRACVVTNGTFPILHLKDIYFYWISIDGNKKTHNQIRGNCAWESTRKNIIDYVQSNGKRHGKTSG